MYQLYFNGYTIYDPRLENYSVFSPAVRLAVGEPGSISFCISNDHPNVSQITKMRGILELQEDGYTVYRGRITKDTKYFDLTRSVESEGILACLNDSIIKPYNFPDDFLEEEDYQTAKSSGNVVAYFLGWLLEQHNSQVTTEQQIKLGNVTVSDSNNYIARSSTDYTKTWEIISENLVGSALGGYLLPRYESDGTYLDYYADFTTMNAQPIRFSENLLDIVSEIDASDIFSVILPIGADGLTIDGLEDGEITNDIVKSGQTIYSKSAISKYGRITKIKQWGDVTQAVNLRTKAAEALSESGMIQTITIKAADLHFEDMAISPFRLGRYVQLSSDPHGLTASYPLMELIPDILDPGNTEITLGCTSITQTDINKSQQQADKDRSEALKIELGNQNAALSELKTYTVEQISKIDQTSSEIKASVTEVKSDLNDAKTRLSEAESTITQHASEIESKVSKDGVISSINQTPETIKIQAKNIDLSGAVTADSIQVGAVTAEKIAPGSVTAEKINVLELFSNNITMTGKFTTTANVFLNIGVEERNIMRKIIAGSVTVSNPEIYDFNNDGVVNIIDLAMANAAIAGRYDLSTWSGAVLTPVTITIDISNPAKAIRITGTNMWGRDVDQYFGANSAFMNDNFSDTFNELFEQAAIISESESDGVKLTKYRDGTLIQKCVVSGTWATADWEQWGSLYCVSDSARIQAEFFSGFISPPTVFASIESDYTLMLANAGYASATESPAYYALRPSAPGGDVNYTITILAVGKWK